MRISHSPPSPSSRDGHGHGHTHGVIDPSIATTARGIWAIKWSFVILAVTALGAAGRRGRSRAVSRCSPTRSTTWPTRSPRSRSGLPSSVGRRVANRPLHLRVRPRRGLGRVGSCWSSYFSAPLARRLGIVPRKLMAPGADPVSRLGGGQRGDRVHRQRGRRDLPDPGRHTDRQRGAGGGWPACARRRP